MGEAESPPDTLFPRQNHNPDVLSCLANLSNDEVFTPPQVANAMLDLLPKELFTSPKTKFLDPCCKSGVFLREIAKRLMQGLEKAIPDKQERLDHILHHQVYGIATTELCSLISRRTLYCAKYATSSYAIVKFANIDGNIRFKNIPHTWKKGKCIFCGASQDQYERKEGLENHAYEFIHSEKPREIFGDMKFDVIIGNPPYHLSDGGQGASSKSIYHNFIKMAKQLRPDYISMIIPARWYTNGKGIGIEEFRKQMMNDKTLKFLIDFKNTADCFPGVNIGGGVCYFLIDSNYNGKCNVSNYNSKGEENTESRYLNEFPIIVRDNIAVNIIRKCDHEIKLNNIVKSYNYFGLRSYERGKETKSSSEDIVILSREGKQFYPRDKIYDKLNIIDDYKVIITYAMSGGNKPSNNGQYQVISSLQTLSPNEVCTETFLILDTFKDKHSATNMQHYVSTKFFRFLLLQALTSIHITKDSFCFTPLQDFSKPWTDAELYAKYGLTQEEIDYIESTIKPMDAAGTPDSA